MMARKGPNWQIILADLALLLFLATAQALQQDAGHSGSHADIAAKSPVSQAISTPQPRPANSISNVSLSVWSDNNSGVSLDAWLQEESGNPYTTIAITMGYRRTPETQQWQRLQALYNQIPAEYGAVRIEVLPTDEESLTVRRIYDQQN